MTQEPFAGGLSPVRADDPDAVPPANISFRTATGAPAPSSWQYVNVRRLMIWLEQSLNANLQWTVFEPNAEPLWSAIRQSVEGFLLGVWRDGQLQGATPSDAFQVACGSDTTTPADIQNGIVNIVVGVAPVVPAEFVVISIAQLAGQSAG
jgi:uncharacterized protein